MKKFYNILLSIALVALAVVGVQAQSVTFYQPLGSNLTIDTVANTGTTYVSTTSRLKNDGHYTNTVIQVNVTKISGTVGGTISLQGSVDGTNWKALNTAETQTALATVTATDATNSYHWRLNGSPFQFYRVSWTGTGTMSASFGAVLYRSK